MKKAELEAKILELEKAIVELRARPICYGHYCGCNHYNYPVYPNYPWYTFTGGTGNPPLANPTTVTFGKVNS